MLRQSVTRRRALQAAAAAAAAATLHPPRALARPRPEAFSMTLRDGAARAAGAGGWRTTAVTRAPRRFDLLGLRWRSGQLVRAEVRARRSHGAWTPWTPLHPSLDHGPDGAAAVRGTEPCWTGSADVFQVRYQGTVGGLSVRFVRARPAAEFSRRLGLRARSRARAAQSQPGTPPPIIPRAQWGGDQVPPKSDPSYGEVQVAFVHHTVSANDYAPEESASIVLGIAKYHQNHNKWNDLGYNFVLDRYGQIFEGRAGGVEQAVIGAQAQGYNRLSTGIACIGTFQDVAFDGAGMDALSRLIAWKLPLHGAPVTGQVTVVSGGGDTNRYPNGAQVTFERISGHRDGCATACPGNSLYGQLPDLRARTASLAVPVSVLTIKPAATTTRHPAPLKLTGTLRFSDNSAAGGRNIEIQHQAAGAGWSRLSTTVTAPDGTWSAGVVVPATGLLRAVFPGDATHPALDGGSVKIKVIPKLTLVLEPRRTPAGQTSKVTGTLGPTWPPRIELVLERQSGKRWVPVTKKRINVRGGKFSSVVRPKKPGRYRVSVIAPGSTTRRLLRAVELSGGAATGV